ncbi:hypothetical protein QBC46DRAFT_107561 [Diplogelasinospora grovesii]|uniref:Uncharacterized protein n=1 Tax=Diplogelasinospora grovesii TaxID=303347 RepID=A0AAN6N8L8_9PEZI|nr:hypothetical protein QBC46DRAFT_107561 [Diplogelasinospora grovesii]
MLPFLEVAHLPSSSSFYSAIIQPLGLRYLYTDAEPVPSITYGTSSAAARPVFQIRQTATSRERPVRLSRIALSAPSAEAVSDAFNFAVRANPDLQRALSGASANRAVERGEKRAKITDFDGNIMELVYQMPNDYPPRYGGSSVRRRQSTSEEASRILHWNYDVASSEISSGSSYRGRTAIARGYDDDDDDEPYATSRRTVTASSATYEPVASPRQNSSGLHVVGAAILGVAAGAVAGATITYNMVKQDRARAPRQEFGPPPFSRRSTYPEQYPEQRRGRYVEVERAVDDYPPVVDYHHRLAPEYATRYSHAGVPKSIEVEDLYEETRSRRHSPHRSRASVRTRSEAATNREPLLLAEMEHRSYVSSSQSSRHHPPIVQRSYTYDTPGQSSGRDSYVSARSNRSSSTVRAPPQSHHVVTSSSPPQVHVTRSKAGSRVTTTTIKVDGSPASVYPSYPAGMIRVASHLSARNIPLPQSRATSHLSARNIPLPDSRAPSHVSARNIPLPRSHANWDDDDVDSVAPSDSISCVGSRRSGRSYRH